MLKPSGPLVAPPHYPAPQYVPLFAGPVRAFEWNVGTWSESEIEDPLTQLSICLKLPRTVLLLPLSLGDTKAALIFHLAALAHFAVSFQERVPSLAQSTEPTDWATLKKQYF